MRLDPRPALLAFVTVVTVAGCAPIGPLLNRAAFDLECSREQLEVVELDTNTKGIRGCGRQATYVWSCGKNQTCAWVMNSPSR